MAFNLKDVLTSPNLLYYAYRRNNWTLDFRRHFADFADIEVESPIFLLGTHGGGLTLVSRMLRRNESVISVSGNHKYWSGADEMAVVLGRMLPFELGGVKHKLPPHPHFDSTTAWVYASDELIGTYRLRAEDATDDLRQTLLRVLRWLIHRHAENRGDARFTDKSQVYTVRASFIGELLRGKNPRFILVTRDPYALAYRAPEKAAALRQLPSSFSRLDKVKIAAQHWKNSVESALEDASELDHFAIVRFEDLLNDPRKHLRHICEVADIEYKESMVPQPDDEVPFGSRYRRRWHPIRPNVNSKYYDVMGDEDVEVIYSICGGVAEKVGYNRPDVI